MKKSPKKSGRVLLDRNAVRSRLKDFDVASSGGASEEDLWVLVEQAANPGEDLAWLAAYDLDPEISSSAVLTLFFAVQCEDIPEDLFDRVCAEARPAILKALQNAAVPDDRKVPLGALYGFCGGELPEEDLRSYFKDFEAASGRVMSRTVGRLSSAPEDIERFVVKLGEGSEEDGESAEDRFKMLVEMLMRADAAPPDVMAAVMSATTVLGKLDGVRDSFLDVGLEYLDAADCPEATWFLAEMGRWPGLGTVGEKAGALAIKKAAAGRLPHHEIGAKFSHGLITCPDGSGTRQMTLFYRTPDGSMDALLFLMNDAIGLKDVVCMYGDGAEIEDNIREQSDIMILAPCTLELAREFVADLWEFHEQAGTAFPPKMFIYRPYLGPEPILPKARKTDLSVYGLDAVPRDDELFRDADLPIDSALYGRFAFSSDAMYDYLAKVGPKKSFQLPKAKFETFVREIAAQEKDLLLSRMAGALETEGWAGRATQQVNRVAARTWLGISENVRPFHEVPFICALAEMSIEMVLQNLRMGFKNQQEVNEAMLEFEDGLNGEFDEEFDEDED